MLECYGNGVRWGSVSPCRTPPASIVSSLFMATSINPHAWARPVCSFQISMHWLMLFSWHPQLCLDTLAHPSVSSRKPSQTLLAHWGPLIFIFLSLCLWLFLSLTREYWDGVFPCQSPTLPRSPKMAGSLSHWLVLQALMWFTVAMRLEELTELKWEMLLSSLLGCALFLSLCCPHGLGTE